MTSTLPFVAARSVCLLASIGLMVSSAEWLLPAHKLAPGGLYGCSVTASNQLLAAWRSSGVRLVLALRLVAAATFICCFALGIAGQAATGALLVAAFSSLLLRVDEPVGLYLGMDGAEGVLTMCLLTTGVAFAIGTPLALTLALAFVTLQAQLEYASAGWTKVHSLRGWARGSHLLRVLASSNYGHPRWAEHARRHPRLTGALSLAVVAFEVAMPAVLLLPRPYAELLLGCALTFHLGSAVMMGFSTFVWAFAATFPAMLCCRDLLGFALQAQR